eukprot:3371638-Heterocapsa_arctica.AAC.1
MSGQVRKPGARRRIGMCQSVLLRRFPLAAGKLLHTHPDGMSPGTHEMHSGKITTHDPEGNT